MKKTLSLISIFICLTIGAFLVSGCSKANTVQPGDTVSITYTATLPDGNIFKSTEKETLNFIVGAGEVIIGLDQGVVGMKQGGTKTLNIKPADAYTSDYNLMNVQKVSKTIFDKLNIQPKEGEIQKLGDISGVIKGTEIDKDGNEFILRDINPPYTRQTLIYKIKITNLIKANLNN